MRYIILLFSLFVFISSVFANDNYSVHKLQNGQTVIIKELHDNAIVTIDTWVKTGSINETDKNTGVSHFLEHLFFKGTNKYPNGEFDKILEAKGAVTNAATSKDYTHYYITIPSKDFELALNMHADMLLNPLIPRKELEKERKVVLEEISRSNDNPSNKLYQSMIKAFYKNHPYKREVIGTKNVIETITREEILDYYNTYYTPQNMVTVIVGDVDTETILPKIENLFIRKNTKNITKQSYKKEKPLNQSCEIINTFDTQTSYMLIGFRGVEAKNLKDTYALDVLATILGQGKTSRLYKNIKENNRLAFIISAGHSSGYDDSIFYINANYKQENYDKLKNSILTEIEHLKKYPITEEELNKAKSIIERDIYYSRESTANIANELGYTTIIFDDTKFYQNYVNNIKKITPQDIQRVAKEYLNTHKMVISVLNPKLQEINLKTNTKEQTTQKQLHPTKQIDNIYKYLLPSKATLIYNNNPANDIIAIQIFAKGGEHLEKIAGTNDLLAAAIIKGTKKYTHQELMTILEENGIRLNINSDADAFTISIKATKNEFPLTMEILNEIIHNANLNTSEIEKIKSEKLQQIQKNRDNPMNVAFENFTHYIWGENSIYSNNTIVLEKTYPKIQTSDIKEMYSKIFEPQNIVISVNGNIEEQKLTQEFSKIFTPTNNKKIEINDFKQSNPKLIKAKNLTINKNSEAAWLVLGWQTSGLENLKDYTTLQIIDSILGTGMSSRLFINLREQQGLAYQVGSIYSPKVNQGMFALFIGTNPKNIELAKNLMLQEITKLKKEFITEKELTAAKDKILGNYILSFETNMEKANTIGWYETTNRGFDFSKQYEQLIQSITTSDIIAAANKYFNENYIYVLVSPNKN